MKISNPYHKEILDLIVSLSGEATAHTFSDDYLGTSHPRLSNQQSNTATNRERMDA